MPKDPHITGGIRHDWAAIKHYYLTDPDATLRKAADKFGVKRDSVYKKSKAEGWYQARKDTQAKVVAKGVAKTVNEMAKELHQDSEFLALMKGHMSRMLNDSEQYQRHLVETKLIDDDGGMLITTEERQFNKFDSKALKDSMQVLQMMEAMTRSLYNLQKAETIQKHQLDAERLQLERERFELEKEKVALERERNALRSQMSGDVDETRYGVVLIPGVIENE